MTPSRPYIIRALYEWILDNGLTPHIVVNSMYDGAQVPQEFVNGDGQIVLNVSPSAVAELELTNDAVSFNARFGGVPRNIYVPSMAILGIYARENGQGMMFDAEAQPDPEPPKPLKSKLVLTKTPTADKKPTSDGRPSLRVVK